MLNWMKIDQFSNIEHMLQTLLNVLGAHWLCSWLGKKLNLTVNFQWMLHFALIDFIPSFTKIIY